MSKEPMYDNEKELALKFLSSLDDDQQEIPIRIWLMQIVKAEPHGFIFGLALGLPAGALIFYIVISVIFTLLGGA